VQLEYETCLPSHLVLLIQRTAFCVMHRFVNAWCGNPSYKPGDSLYWNIAWTRLGSCSGEFLFCYEALLQVRIRLTFYRLAQYFHFQERCLQPPQITLVCQMLAAALMNTTHLLYM
jgi:hypothetical protein